ncbi:uncharacterized protein M6B38_357105 [Iris pallida]|uniref:NADH dehydrogenase subunit 6 n=1 Tax=Iris pallida TaxID=29817 RepID=A0AAX6GMQ8_IRIPA|nr:uncharacterized protein M6B38_357105 [Iris pallida]
MPRTRTYGSRHNDEVVMMIVVAVLVILVVGCGTANGGYGIAAVVLMVFVVVWVLRIV